MEKGPSWVRVPTQHAEGLEFNLGQNLQAWLGKTHLKPCYCYLAMWTIQGQMDLRCDSYELTRQTAYFQQGGCTL